jgi:hypothetical protein
MKDILQDLIQYTSLGEIDLIKVTGTDTETSVAAITKDVSVIFAGKFYKPCAEFSVGTFGMPNLGKLKTILSFEDIYDDPSSITLTQRVNAEGVTVPDAIHFQTKSGDFVNDYRLMSKATVESLVKTVRIAALPNWNVEFDPTVVSIIRLKKQQQANTEEVNCVFKLEKGEIKIYFGDAGTHSGSFVFQSNVSGSFAPIKFPVAPIVSILSLPGDKKFRIADVGVMEITVDSGLALYSYMLPAQSK